jgi:two-component system, NtrC family, response regulator HydG
MVGSLHILIVDDDTDNANSLAELFEIEGHTVSIVHSGEDAIRAYLNRNYDLAFMDVMMPGKNGVESFLEIRKLKPHAKIIMMTGYSVEQLLQQAMENGALGVLTKPMEPAKILDMINDVGPTGIVVAQSSGIGVADKMKVALLSAGRECRLVHDGEDVKPGHIGNSGEVLIYDLHRPLIDTVGVYTEMKRRGVCGPTILLTDTDIETEDPHDLFRDFRATGILNKPFDPDHLLSQLQVLAA